MTPCPRVYEIYYFVPSMFVRTINLGFLIYAQKLKQKLYIIK